MILPSLLACLFERELLVELAWNAISLWVSIGHYLCET